MSNLAYLGVWCRDFPEEKMPERLAAFLATVPFSATRPGFTALAVRAVNAAETPVLEEDLRAVSIDAERVIEMTTGYLQADSSCEVSSHWDLWSFDAAAGKSVLGPEPLTVFCNGLDYDEGVWHERGHFSVDLGFEHFFTGHAGVLAREAKKDAPQSHEEARFLEAMAWPDVLEAYRDKTRENIRKLFDWVRQIERTLPVDKVLFWSEGEENFEARIEEILAAR
ncbi:MAG TPA: hypothetical protein VMJ93_09130 [Verrucomicrobiae bacterium]|nr:hypothetical protein [Verrucomicrobiae bacterium]